MKPVLGSAKPSPGNPLLARFGSADPVTEDPFSTQGWNRYSYVGNSPVNFTDPSGYCFMGCFWKPVFKAIGQFFQQSWGTILQIGATMLCAGNPVCAAAVAMITSTFVAGVSGGSLAQALRAGLLSGLKAAAFYAVGTITSGFEGTLTEAGGHGPLAFGSPAHLVNMVGHAAVGCGFAVAEGGKCGPGAASGAAGSFAGPMLTGLPHEASLVAHSVVGGLASVAGGGKFANGALTAAFGYLFNQTARPSLPAGGCCFSSSDLAAVAILDLVNPLSILANVEIGGLIYRNSEGLYGYTAPIWGTSDGVNPSFSPVPKGAIEVGNYHTHANYAIFKDGVNIPTGDPARDSYRADMWSNNDKFGIARMAKESGVPGYRGYLATPGGLIRYFQPDSNLFGRLR